jgi:hypothetical protein
MYKYFFKFSFFILLAINSNYVLGIQTCNDFGHFDLVVNVDPPGVDGAKFLIDANGEFPVDSVTGKTIVPADLGDFAGGPHKTDDPGWVVKAGDLLGGELLWFRAIGSLKFWDPTKQRWMNKTPNGERVRYTGIIPPEIILNGSSEEIAFYSAGTIWSDLGIDGPLEAPIEEAANIISGDTIHAHLDFCIEGEISEGVMGDCTVPGVGHTGSPSIGIYMIEIQLFSNQLGPAGVRQKYIDSEPIKIILNNGLVNNDCAVAIDTLTNPDLIQDDSGPLPSSGILIMTGP